MGSFQDFDFDTHPDPDARAGEFDGEPEEETVDAEFARLLAKCPQCGCSIRPNARQTVLGCDGCGWSWEAP